MKTSRGLLVASASASLLAAGWAAGAGFIDDTAVTTASAAIDTSTASSSESPSADPSTESPSPQATPSTSVTAEAATPEPSTSEASSESAPGVTGTYDGDYVQTRYGTFQVELTIDNGVITNATMLQSGESRGESQQINARALPVLLDAIVSEQKSAVGYVSGASYTSEAVMASAASALRAAGLE